MDLNPSWEATSCSATQEIPTFLRNQKAYLRVHESPLLDSLRSQMNLIHTPSYFSKMHFNIILPSTSMSPYCFFPSGLSVWTVRLSYVCYMPCQSYPTGLRYSNISSGVQALKLHIMQFSPASSYFIPPGSKYYHPTLRYSRRFNLTMRDSVSRLYRTTEKLRFCAVL
jgi:hypothetical protein